MPKLEVKKYCSTLGEARDFLMLVAQEINAGHKSGKAWKFGGGKDQPDEPQAPETKPEGKTPVEAPKTQPDESGEADDDENDMPWDKNKS